MSNNFVRGMCRVAVLMIAGLGWGCISVPMTPVLPVYAGGFNLTTAPVDTTFRSTTLGPRTGEAEAYSVLGLFTWGDCSLDAAIRAGKLTQVHHLDCELLNVVGIYQRYTLKAVGMGAPDD